MTSKSKLSPIVDQLSNLLSIIKDRRQEISTSKPVLEYLLVLEQQLKTIGDFVAGLPSTEPLPEEVKALERLDRVRKDSEKYQKLISKTMEKQQKSGSSGGETKIRSTQQARKRKFDALKKL